MVVLAPNEPLSASPRDGTGAPGALAAHDQHGRLARRRRARPRGIATAADVGLAHELFGEIVGAQHLRREPHRELLVQGCARGSVGSTDSITSRPAALRTGDPALSRTGARIRNESGGPSSAAFRHPESAASPVTAKVKAMRVAPKRGRRAPRAGGVSNVVFAHLVTPA